MNLNVDSFSRIDYSDNESVGSVDSKCSVSSIVSTSSQISTVSSNESSYLKELAYIDFSEDTRSPWLPDNGKTAYKLTKLVEYVMRRDYVNVLKAFKTIVNPRGSTQYSRSSAYTITGQVIYTILVWLYDNVDRSLLHGYIDETDYQNRLDMNLRAGFKFLSGTRDAPEKNLIIYTYNSICKICWADDFNKQSFETLKKIIAQHEATFKRKLKTWKRHLEAEKIQPLYEFEKALKLLERYVAWVTKEDNTVEFEDYGDRLKVKAIQMNTEFSKTIANHIENKILTKLNGSNAKEYDYNELKIKCETSYVSPARIQLSEIYFNEGEYEKCAELLAPFCDMWLETEEKSIELWRMIYKCVRKVEFIQAWEDIVDEDIREYFNEIFEAVISEFDIDLNVFLQSETNCSCDNCDLCVVNLLMEIGEKIMAD